MNLFKIVIGILFLLLFSCQEREEVIVENYETGQIDTIPVFYFPDTMDNHLQGWYSRQLYAMEEPSLFDTVIKDSEIYRFTYLPSFSMPLTIRVEHKTEDTIINLYAKTHNGAGGYPPKEIGMKLFRELLLYPEYNVWDSLLLKLDNFDFWNQDFDNKWGKNGEDGTMFIIEGLKNGQYKIIHRWSPRPNAFPKATEFKEVCDYFHYLMTIGVDKLNWGGNWENMN